MATAKIVLSSSVKKTSETKCSVTITVKYYGNGVSWVGDPRPGKVTFDGTTKSFSHSFTTSTSAQTLATLTFTGVDRNKSSRSLTAKGTFSAGVSIGTISDSISVTIPGVPTYTVRYNANGGTGAPSSQTKYHGYSLTLSSKKPTRSGYTFKGWGLSSGDTSVNYYAGGSYKSNSSDTLYAIWARSNVTITLDTDGGVAGKGTIPDTTGWTISSDRSKATKSVNVNSSVGTLPTITPPTGYSFDDWYTSRYTGSQVSSSRTYSSNTTIYAHYTSTLSFNRNGHGPSSINSVTMNYTDKVVLPSLARDGTYVHQSWATSANPTTTPAIVYRPGSIFKPAKSYAKGNTLYAIWSEATAPAALNSYSIKRAIMRGTSFEESTSGEYFIATISWVAGQDSTGVHDTKLTIEYEPSVQNAGEYAEIEIVYEQSFTGQSSGDGNSFLLSYDDIPFTLPVGQTGTFYITLTDTTEEGNIDPEDEDPYQPEIVKVNVDEGGYLMHIPRSEKSIKLFGVANESDNGLIVENDIKAAGNIRAAGNVYIDNDIKLRRVGAAIITSASKTISANSYLANGFSATYTLPSAYKTAVITDIHSQTTGRVTFYHYSCSISNGVVTCNCSARNNTDSSVSVAASYRLLLLSGS